MIHKGKQMISDGDKNIMSVEVKGKRNKNLPIFSLDVAIHIKAYELHVEYEPHSSTVTKVMSLGGDGSFDTEMLYK
jgi:hypothetical protein